MVLMRIKDYFIDKCFLSLTAYQVLGSWVKDPEFSILGSGSWGPKGLGPEILGSWVTGPKVPCPHFRLCHFVERNYRHFKSTLFFQGVVNKTLLKSIFLKLPFSSFRGCQSKNITFSACFAKTLATSRSKGLLKN